GLVAQAASLGPAAVAVGAVGLAAAAWFGVRVPETLMPVSSGGEHRGAAWGRAPARPRRARTGPMEESTRSPRRATEAIFRTHPQAVVVYDPPSLELLAVNPRAAAVFGLPTGPAPGRTLRDIHAGDLPPAIAQAYAGAQTPFLAALNGAPTV